MTTEDLTAAKADADALATTARELPRDARSVLLYAESCIVDHGGLLEGERMNAEDHEALRQFQAMGLLTYGRIPMATMRARNAHLSSKPTHWCRFTSKAWTLAHLCRMIRAEQVGPYATAVFAEVDHRQADHRVEIIATHRDGSESRRVVPASEVGAKFAELQADPDVKAVREGEARA